MLLKGSAECFVLVQNTLFELADGIGFLSGAFRTAAGRSETGYQRLGAKARFCAPGEGQVGTTFPGCTQAPVSRVGLARRLVRRSQAKAESVHWRSGVRILRAFPETHPGRVRHKAERRKPGMQRRRSRVPGFRCWMSNARRSEERDKLESVSLPAPDTCTAETRLRPAAGLRRAKPPAQDRPPPRVTSRLGTGRGTGPGA